ncbi:MAG: type II toxin-antitoxin system YafQ family toxin [Propionibacteriaceae bacterium]|jgi:mRNA interferase YafQ|nr:type II toxin-antitoxin system YafQ family toxin [Propionibacteriaceae bacterium]
MGDLSVPWEFEYSGQFRRDLKLMQRRHLPLDELNDVLKVLLARQPLDAKYRDHDLSSAWTGFRECHIQPDWLLIYKADNATHLISLARTGSHSDLFG